MEPNFTIIPGDLRSHMLLHVPHASTMIPGHVRPGILLNDAELAAELVAMTDADTDDLAALAAGFLGYSGLAPWQFVNLLSRLVIDPERFPDEREELNEKGMGAVYTRTHTGQPLRDGVDESLIRDYFEPYAEALADAVDARLAATGSAVIVDIHSYPKEPSPYEVHQDAHRPEVCLGVDDDHTPGWLLDAAEAAFDGWDVGINEPFTGTYVPLRHYGTDLRVSSIMIELRRDVLADPVRFTDAAIRINRLLSKVPATPLATAGKVSA